MVAEIRTCFTKTSDGDLVAVFCIDSRRYPNADAYQQVVAEARDETNRRRIAYEWRIDYLEPVDEWLEYRPSQPTWEEFRS